MLTATTIKEKHLGIMDQRTAERIIENTDDPVIQAAWQRAAEVINLAELTGARMRLDRFRESIGPDIFDALITNKINRRLAKAYAPWPLQYKNWVKVTSPTDLLDNIIVQMGQLPNLDSLDETGGEFYEIDVPSDTEITYSVGGWGNIIAVDFKTKRNDNLGYFDQLGDRWGQATGRTFHKWLYVTNLQSNPTIFDGNNLFDASNHNNDLDSGGTGKALNYANLMAAIKLLEGQTSDDEPIYLGERFGLIVGYKNRGAAQALKQAEYNPDNANNEPNVYGKMIDWIIVSPYLGTDWYVVANPDMVETFEVGFLDGVEEPEIVMERPESSFYFESMKTRFRLDFWFGGAWADYRGIVRGSTNA